MNKADLPDMARVPVITSKLHLGLVAEGKGDGRVLIQMKSDGGRPATEAKPHNVVCQHRRWDIPLESTFALVRDCIFLQELLQALPFKIHRCRRVPKPVLPTSCVPWHGLLGD